MNKGEVNKTFRESNSSYVGLSEPKECDFCRHAQVSHGLEPRFSRIELTIYRSAFIVVLIVEFGKYIKYLLTVG